MGDPVRVDDAVGELGLEKTGRILAASGYFSDARDTAQAIVKVMAGRELGMGPFESMTGIHIIKGRPVLGAHSIAAAIKRHPSYDYRVTERSATMCAVEFFERGESLGVERWDIARAKRAGLSGANWTGYPEAMLFARAISSGYRTYCPDVFSSAVYVDGELGDDTPPREAAAPRPVEVEVVQQIGPDHVLRSVDFGATPEHHGMTAGECHAWQGRAVAMARQRAEAMDPVSGADRELARLAYRLQSERHSADIDAISARCETDDDFRALCASAGVRLSEEEDAAGLDGIGSLSRARVKKLLAAMPAYFAVDEEDA